MIDTKTELKQSGATFWDTNPCGGEWSSYTSYMEWIRLTEPYIFNILDQYDWGEKHVLEVGCGQGTTLNYLPQNGAKVMGIDMSSASIRRAFHGAIELDHITDVKFAVSDAEDLPFENESFDTVISIGVLHHTPDTVRGVREIYRVLKPDGTAIVMLYRSGNPKWWMTRSLRIFSNLIDRLTGHSKVLATRLRARQRQDGVSGTAILELFGVPVLNAFSNDQCFHLFSQFSKVSVTNHQAGFMRLIDISPFLAFLKPGLKWFDETMREAWGFYQVIEVTK